MVVIAGKYEVLDALGQGASGWVYLVRNRELNKQFALKVLSTACSENPALVTRFRNEAEVLARFNHPGSLGLRDFGRTETGQYYLATDYSPGTNLDDYLVDRERLTPIEALDIVRQLLEVLEAAHQMGIIHRDIKPENVMIEKTADGLPFARILDFGVAKLRDALGVDPGVTQEGSTVGTPYYMSPEQAAGEGDLDGRADVYSTGILLYELLSGELPFVGTTALQTMLLHLTAPPPSLRHIPGIPSFLERLVFKALEKDPDDRYSSALAFADACVEALELLCADELPEELEDSGATLPPQQPPRPPALTSAPGAKKILCVDDDPGTLFMLSYILKREGYEVHALSCGRDIAKLICDEQVRFVICDINMPGLSGPNVCRLLKRKLPDLTFVLFSGVLEVALAEAATECGADAWISKGWPVEEWLGRINRLMQSTSLRAEVQNHAALD